MAVSEIFPNKFTQAPDTVIQTIHSFIIISFQISLKLDKLLTQSNAYAICKRTDKQKTEILDLMALPKNLTQPGIV